PSISEAAAVSATDADGVAAVALFYVLKGGAPIDGDAGLRTCIEALSPHQRPRWLRPLDALPRTATGKLLRRKLQDLHRTLAARDEAAPDTTAERQVH
ncbi:MAG TPA: hypothetical protein VFR50_13860, partial [Casimicrobiaceae bacterium]|nr:hypothetical protein [Casimicrobiaceae bacterium]